MSERTGTFRLLEQSGGGASGSIPAISEQRFVVNRMGRTIPGVVWMPQRVSDRVPLVLVQHGGSGHKADASVLAFVRQLSALYGFAAAAIDGPLHGERRSHGTEASVMLAEFLAYWEEGPDIESYVEEWRSVIDSLSKFDRVDADRIGWYGPSMGTVYGMPLLARESRVKAAVLGKWSAYHANSRHLVEVASHVSSPTLFVQRFSLVAGSANSSIKLPCRSSLMHCLLQVGKRLQQENWQILPPMRIAALRAALGR